MQRSLEVAMLTAAEAMCEAINSKKQCIDLQQVYEKVQAAKVLIQVKLDSIFEKQLAMECQSRRSNQNVDNVPEKINEKPHETQIIFRDVLERNMKCGYAGQVKLERWHRAGKNVDGKARTVIAKFNFFEDIADIWQHRSSLKVSGCHEVAARTIADTLLFFHMESPFNNYHPSGFIVDNIHYTCNEQFYQSKKTEHFNDDETTSKIMKTDNPYTRYNQGKLIKEMLMKKNGTVDLH